MHYLNFLSFLLFPINYYICIWALNHSPDLSSVFEDFGAYPSAGDESHAFVQTGAELHYFRDISHQDIYIANVKEKIERFV